MKRFPWVLVVCAFFGASPAGKDATDGVVRWMWSGGVTFSSAVVKARLVDPAAPVQMELCAGENCEPAPVPAEAAETSVDEYAIVTVRLRGLRPATLYRYRFAQNGSRSLVGSFRTFGDGPFSFRVAFGSCATTGSEHKVFLRIRDLEPDLFLHMGDFHYEDIDEPDVEEFLEAYDEVLTSKTQAELFRHVPVAYIWDDHDFGPDGSDRTAPGRLAALEAYRRAVPHYPLLPLEADEATIQQAFTVGRIRFILTDLRAGREPARGKAGRPSSMLGLPQRRWLLKELAAAAAAPFPLLIWVSTVPWIAAEDADKPVGWAPYARERELIAARIRSLGLARRMLMLSGDAHMVAIDDGTHSNFAPGAPPGEKGFPVVHAAPFDRYPRKKGGPYSHGTATGHAFFPWDKVQQFGFLEVEDSGDVLRVRVTGRDEHGRVIPGMELRMTCTAAGCRVE
ncbi:MAG: hypothetical protein Kow00109_25540 [Acidobacteriota bacterium]